MTLSGLRAVWIRSVKVFRRLRGTETGRDYVMESARPTAELENRP